MKSINKLALAAVLALTGASLASAQSVTVIRMTGSTAFRAADVTAEVSYLHGLGGNGVVTAEYFQNPPSGVTTVPLALTNASTSVIYGPIVGTTQTVFENAFNGSIAGAETTTTTGQGVITPTFAKAASYSNSATAVTVGNSTTLASGGTSFGSKTPTAGTTENTFVPDIAFCDAFNDTVLQIIGNTPFTQNLTPTDTVIGIIPFVFVCQGTTDVTSKLTGLNMDPQKFTYLWNTGKIPLSFFTGVNADSTSSVYALGRDVDSGTRATTLCETGYTLNGSGNAEVTAPVVQYFPYDNATDASHDFSSSTGTGTYVSVGEVGDTSAAPIGAMGLVPKETFAGYFMSAGDGGYNSGGNLAVAFSTPFSNSLTKTVLMTSLGISDAQAALAATNHPFLMSYNGFTFDPTAAGASSANSQLIYSGKYTFWGYEHEFTTTSTSAAGLAAATGMANLLLGGLDQVGSNGVAIASMQVGRSDDGQSVQTGNPY